MSESSTPPASSHPALQTASLGLSSKDAARLLAELGPNEISREKPIGIPRLAARQFASPVIWLLFGASVVSAALGERTNSFAIGAIVVVNAAIGFLQEHRAERAVRALRSLTAPRARLVRDGRSTIVSASAVVPGDVLVIEAGDVVAADARLLTAHTLTTNEAMLTGESAPVAKTTRATLPGAPLAERHDRVFMGTSVATGTALAEVLATGMRTELGRIAHLLAAVEDDVGLIGIADPPRTEAVTAVAAARTAGITTVMVTGDHPATARTIAEELGILSRGTSAADFVHARATPEDKIRIVREWEARGAVVAMTGDGVNDAPALREAHIGIAMGP